MHLCVTVGVRCLEGPSQSSLARAGGRDQACLPLQAGLEAGVPWVPADRGWLVSLSQKGLVGVGGRELNPRAVLPQDLVLLLWVPGPGLRVKAGPWRRPLPPQEPLS